MFQIIIVADSHNPNLPNVVMTFKSNEKAMHTINLIAKAKKDLENLELVDEYGYYLVINGKDILHALFIDLEQAEVCRFETNMHTARTGKKLGDRVSKNPEEMELLKALNPPPRNSAPPSQRSSIIQ